MLPFKYRRSDVEVGDLPGSFSNLRPSGFESLAVLPSFLLTPQSSASSSRRLNLKLRPSNAWQAKNANTSRHHVTPLRSGCTSVCACCSCVQQGSCPASPWGWSPSTCSTSASSRWKAPTSRKKCARRVRPVLERHHLLLVTFLVVNATANEALPIFLDKLVPEGVSIILSVTCVLMFGEIIPAAFFTGPNQLKVAAALCPLVRVLMAVVFPIAYPIIKLLDWWLGADHDAAQYKRNELKALVALQRESEALRQSYVESIKYDYESESCHSSTSSCASVLMSPKTLRKQPLLKPEPEAEVAIEIQVEIPDQHKRRHQRKAKDTRLNVDEVTIIHGALDLSSKTVTEVMIAMSEVFMLEIDTKLDRNTMADILASGHSRIPVYETRKSNIVGLLLVKKLIVLDPDDAHPIRDLVLRRSHIALVTKDAELVSECWHSNQPIPPHVLFEGIVTIEDVIEELIQEKIEDESGVYVHDIVDYWNTKSQQSRLQAVAAKAFITKKLETLAERARLRVRDRRLHAATQINVNDESAKKKLSP